MTRIQSLEDLANARAEALARRDAGSGRVHIRVGMGSCGIAAGAGDTLEALYWLVAEGLQPETGANLVDITTTGCIGLCALEPIVQVQIAGGPPVTYGKVTPEIARRIVDQHLRSGLVVEEYVVETV